MKKASLRIYLSRRPVAVCAGVLLAAFILLGLFAGLSVQLVMTRIVCMALVAVSLNLQFGFGGMTNMGGGLIFSLASYAVMIGAMRFGWPLLPSILFALVIMIPVSAFIGYICLRNNMLTFTFCSMGLTMVGYSIICKMPFMGQDTGLVMAICPEWMADTRVQFFVFLAIVVVCFYIIHRFTSSPFMQVIVGARENDERLTFLGVNIRNARLVIFVISSFFASVAGVLYAIMNNGAFISSVDPIISIQALLMCVLGGASTLLGPVIGSIIVVSITNIVASFTVYYKAVLGLVTLLCVFFMPNGILSKDGKILTGVSRLLSGNTIGAAKEAKKCRVK